MTAASRPAGDVWLRRGSALVVAAVAAYASYEHQRRFALAGGADDLGARLWPLSVDGLVLLATDGLLRTSHATARRRRLALWAAFSLGIAVSLAANIAAAPTLDWRSVLVAGWPPVALLLAVELLAYRSTGRARTETIETIPTPRAAGPGPAESREPSPMSAADQSVIPETAQPTDTGAHDADPVITLARPENGASRNGKRNAERIMWAHYERERAAGRTPTGAELDRVAGTNNYGRAVLARWRRRGQLKEARGSGSVLTTLPGGIGGVDRTEMPVARTGRREGPGSHGRRLRTPVEAEVTRPDDRDDAPPAIERPDSVSLQDVRLRRR